MATDMMSESLGEIGIAASSLIIRCETTEDALAVAVSLCVAAEKIFKSLGGNRFAAAQFYHLADKAAIEPPEAA